MYFLDTNICIYYLRGLYKSIEDHFELLSNQEMNYRRACPAVSDFSMKNLSIDKKFIILVLI
jgi:predicted nucleic acid-binding protein